MKKLFFCLFCAAACCSAGAQYAPQAGLPGSTAISGTSGQFVAWATQCAVQRGFMDIANPSLGYASVGDSSQATGPADLGVVSLGDSGVATLTFAHPIIDEPGADFAVFENGFLDPANDSQAFLELAFVEVSSDGVQYFRFPATSLTRTDVQISNGNYINAIGLNNLAGKYIALYGTPFDLQELAGKEGLDINNVTHVRIIDVVGSLGAHAQHDSAGRIVNDPYPTAFPSCGFDLDAVGVIHQAGTGTGTLPNGISIKVYPNPAADKIIIAASGTLPEAMSATLTDITGCILQRSSVSQASAVMYVARYPAGMYYLILQNASGEKWVEKVIKR